MVSRAPVWLRAAAIVALAALGGCGAAWGPRSAAQPAGLVCLRSYEIDHTDVPNDSTILFTMRDHSVWKNVLPSPCLGLSLETRGFVYQPTDPGADTICSNLVTIRMRTTGSVCLLGPFVRVVPPPPGR